MQALMHRNPIWQHQMEMSMRDRNNAIRMARRARARIVTNTNVARLLEPAPLTPLKVFETEAGQRYYQVMKEGGRVSLPFVSILR